MRINAFVSRLCVAVLGFLGYSCHNTVADMYGCPTGTWEIKGEVTEQETSAPAPATVKVTEPNIDSSAYSITETRTDDRGQYDVKSSGWPESALKVVCIPDDPALEPDSTIVDLKYSGADKKDPWYEGNAEATADFRLKKKEQ